jgi:formyl-CoA transferase
MLGCANQRTWERFCQDVIARDDLISDERFATNSDRGRNVEQLESVLEEILSLRETAYWLDRCDIAGVPAGPINNFAQAMQDEHFLARGMVEEIEHPVIGKMKTVGFPSKFSRTPSQIRSPAPLFAQHTDEILHNVGVSEEEVSNLRQAGCIK